MNTENHYQILSVIKEDIHSCLYRGELVPGKRPILIKELKPIMLNPKSLARLRHDFDILREHPTSASLEAYALIEQDGNVALCLEDVEGIFLSDLLKKGAMPYQEFLPLAQAITRALGALHAEHIIHKNLNPNNILWSKEKNEIKILDFSIATTLEKETPTDVAGSVLEGTLPYMSPEQTGRMNISLDYRSDFYALGVIFYQLLTGRLPFLQSDMLELVHAHLALMPEPPHSLNSSLPELLSKIILKLLDKRPDQRYQTASGLLHDLEKVSMVLEKIETAFTLGESDVNPSLQISSKLYGREEIIKTLQEDYAQVLEGNKCLTLVAGAPGIGKTSVVNELYKPITERAGFFIRGKYDQLQSNRPYSALSQALENLIRQILLAPEEEVQEWKNQLNEALSPNGQIMVNIIPILQHLIGKQEAPPTIDPTQEESRLHYVFEQFIRVLATEAHPLALFLDDLQWVDLASLKVFQHLFPSEAARYLYFVGAYRDNEVSDTHPLIYALAQFKKAGIETHQLKLGPLDQDACKAWLADTLNSTVKDVESLAKLCFDKTAGNPFFLKQFVQALYEDRLLKLDLEQKRWVWDIKQVEEKQMTDNVIELMSSKIKNLPEPQVALLKLAACIGNRFNLEMLLNITGRRLDEVSAILWELFRVGLILPENEEYKYLNQDQVRPQSIACYFLHDRVQEAAYSLMDENSREKTHLDIGYLLLKKIPEQEYEAHIFDILDHLNKGRLLISDPAEKLMLAKLNFLGAQKATEATAFLISKEFITVGLELLGEKHWETQYELSLGFYQALALANLLLGQYEEVHKIAGIGIKQGKTALDRSEFYHMRIDSYSIVSQFEKAVEIVRISLAELGLKVPKQPRVYHALINYLKILWALRRQKVADLGKAPSMQDLIIKARIRILTIGHLSLAFTKQFYFPWEVSLRTLYLIRYGSAEEASAIYADFGYMLVYDELNIPLAREFMELTEYYIKKYPNNPYNIFAGLICTAFVAPAYASVHDVSQNSVELYHLSKRNTDAVWGIASLVTAFRDILWEQRKSETLDSILSFDGKYKKEVVLSQNPFGILMVEQSSNFLKILVGDLPVPSKFVNEDLVKNAALKTYSTAYLVHAATQAFTFDAYDQADEIFQRSIQKDAPLHKHLSVLLMAYVYSSLIKLAKIPKLGLWKRRKYFKSIRENQKHLQKRMMFYKDNLEHYYFLVEAEICRVQGDDEKAQRHYSHAIELAEKNDFVFALALCNELAAKYYYGRGRLDVARFYMQETLAIYTNWGALGKVRHLKALYPSMSIPKNAVLSSDEATLTSTLTATSNEAFDLSTVMRANQAISGEIQLPKLMEKMLHIVIENAGAERAMFIEKMKHHWKPLAHMEEKSQKVKFKFYSEETEACEFPEKVINYCVRTQEPLVLANAIESDEFQNDPYIKQHKIRSLLCLPIIQHQEILGIIYLENNLTVGAFTQDRVSVLTTLASQIAISLKNSHYLANMEKLYSSTERFVPKPFLNLLKKENIEEIKVGDSIEVNLAPLFADIRNFTTLSEVLGTEKTAYLLNAYIQTMSPIIRRRNGFVNQFLGDGILALFPRNYGDALDAAIEMRSSLGEFNEMLKKQGFEPIEMGIGINAGPAMLITLGEEERIEPSVVSDVVNSAARIEGLNKLYGTGLLISGAVYDSIKNPSDYLIRLIDKVKVIGKKEALSLYEVMALEKDEELSKAQDYITEFQAAFSSYLKGDFKMALQGYSHCLLKRPNDPVAALFKHRCESLLSSGAPRDWDGTYTALEK